MTVGKDPGESTMIRLTYEVKELLEKEKIIHREPLNDCIERLIKENQKLKKIYFTTQTRERMEADIKNFVMNPDVPEPKGDHRKIYQDAHPDEVLSQDDHIHHINGNHDDNRIENLQKVNASTHGILHSKLNDNLGVDKN